jgi:hypothetical protein
VRHFAILFLFYRIFWIPALSISVVGFILVKQSHSVSYGMVFSIAKLITNILLGILFHIFKNDQLYFYHNLGLSAPSLYTQALALDMALWFSLLTLILFL